MPRRPTSRSRGSEPEPGAQPGAQPGPVRPPFGTVRLERAITPVPPPATVRHPPGLPLGPSVPMPVLSFAALRRLP
ncbi:MULTISPECIES: hypothetical protein [Streptacidiphilus]|uniref:Uncharacterized protein n=1 Tax=Streptacidiphilus cavernicola TaxID=3342716 RepID=A0ABV6V049_9ACTN|nr:hypothetical protein [Streptacidiphilus jeojiense]